MKVMRLEFSILSAVLLSLGAAIALGLTRFSYAMLLPPMRADLDWSYLLAGSMNTANAVGYLCGAVLAPFALKGIGPQRTLLVVAGIASALMFLVLLSTDTYFLLAQRFSAGVSSALIFVAGGLLATKLSSDNLSRSGLILGIYYGGTGLGIVLSAILVPLVLHCAACLASHQSWQVAWAALGVVCVLFWGALFYPARKISYTLPKAVEGVGFDVFSFRYALLAYMMFGAGYIGYMTFIIALLRENGVSDAGASLFYSLLGISVVLSSRLWHRLLDKYKGGQALSILTGLLALFCVLPVFYQSQLAAFVSGIGFGGVFLSVVASTTALVRHNLPQAAWSAGISAFTTAFAIGQIVGPVFVGWVSDRSSGLQTGFLASGLILFIGSVLAVRQRPLVRD